MNDLIKIENGQLAQTTVDLIKELETKKKEFDKQYDKFKAELLEAMESNGIVKFDNEDLMISYVAESERETFDSKQFKNDMPELYDEYVKISKTKASIRIKVK